MGSVRTRHGYTVSVALQTARQWDQTARPRVDIADTTGSNAMPDKKTIERARRDKRQGKSATTQAGEFVRAQIDKIRRGFHGARSSKQAIAIGLSEARRAGVDLPPPGKGKTKSSTRKSARYAYEAGQGKRKPRRRPRVSRAVTNVLKHEPRRAASA
jgi:hypothetical protein